MCKRIFPREDMVVKQCRMNDATHTDVFLFRYYYYYYYFSIFCVEPNVQFCF